MRLMSFAHTTPQVLARTKTVTRRDGWKNLKPGTVLRAVDKCMGFRKGEHPRELAIIRVVSVRREPLSAITDDDVVREGFGTGRRRSSWPCGATRSGGVLKRRAMSR